MEARSESDSKFLAIWSETLPISQLLLSEKIQIHAVKGYWHVNLWTETNCIEKPEPKQTTANEALLSTSYVAVLHQILAYSEQMFIQDLKKNSLPSAIQAEKQLSVHWVTLQLVQSHQLKYSQNAVNLLTLTHKIYLFSYFLVIHLQYSVSVNGHNQKTSKKLEIPLPSHRSLFNMTTYVNITCDLILPRYNRKCKITPLAKQVHSVISSLR